MRMTHTLLIAFAVIASTFQASAAQAGESLTVAVAANMSYAFDELKAEFSRQTGIEIQPVISSSGKISTQVQHGAPFDVFLSADTQYPETLHRQGLTASEPRIYAYGVLVLWTNSSADVSGGLAVLIDSSIHKVAIANPEVAPYGREAVRAMTRAGVYDAVVPKLVFGESIAQATHFIETGAADIGFTARSVVDAPAMRGKGRWVEVPADSYEPIAQAAVVLQHGKEHNADAAQRFFDFLFSEPARQILARFGYRLP
jgi:molybdate transport system substrate-binding protein